VWLPRETGETQAARSVIGLLSTSPSCVLDWAILDTIHGQTLTSRDALMPSVVEEELIQRARVEWEISDDVVLCGDETHSGKG
jgi:hypothetical protein